MHKKATFFIALLIFVLSVSCVFASNINETEFDDNPEDGIDDTVNDNVTSVEEESSVSSGTFSDLANEIDSSSGELNLNKNYAYSDDDESYKDGIVIDKSIVINGNGFKIDAKNQARHFILSSFDSTNEYNILIKNVTFINGNAYELENNNGGAIYCEEDCLDCRIENCKFVNNSAQYSGAIYSEGNQFSLFGCEFINNSAKYGHAASAVTLNGEMCSIDNCVFINNTPNRIISFGPEGGMKGNYFYPFYGDVYSTVYGDGRDLVFVKKDCTIECRDIAIYYSNYSGTVTLKDLDGIPLENRNVSFFKGGNYDEQYYSITDENGVASLPLELFESVGNFTVAVRYDGDLNYEKSEVKFNLVIKPLETLIDCSDVSLKYLDDNVSVVVHDVEGAPLSNMKVVFLVKGNSDYSVTDENGVARIPSGLVDAAGNYTVVVKYGGDSIYGNCESQFNLEIKPLSTNIILYAQSAVYNEGKYLKVTLKDENGNLVNDKKVSVNIKGKTPLTTKNGVVKFSLNGLKPQKYAVKVTFAGDNNYIKSTKNVKVTINKATPKITAKTKKFKRFVKTKKYTITLKNNKNKVMKKVKVTLKINGKTYRATTNKYGKATFKIIKLTKKGNFKAKIRYGGSAYYKAVNKSIYIKIR